MSAVDRKRAGQAVLLHAAIEYANAREKWLAGASKRNAKDARAVARMDRAIRGLRSAARAFARSGS